MRTLQPTFLKQIEIMFLEPISFYTCVPAIIPIQYNLYIYI